MISVYSGQYTVVTLWMGNGLGLWSLGLIAEMREGILHMRNRHSLYKLFLKVWLNG
jgi:hypothetical protein